MQENAILLLNTFLLLLGVALIATTALVLPSQSYKSAFTAPLYNGTGTSSVWQVYVIPPGTSYDSLKATLAAGCISVWATIVFFFSYLHNNKRFTRSYSLALAIGCTIILAAVAFIWSFVATYTSDYAYHGPFPETFGGYGGDTVGAYGTFSFESWNCQTVSLHIPGQRGQSRRWCTLSEISRWLTIPLCVTSGTILMLWLLELRWQREQQPLGEVEMHGRKVHAGK